MTVWILNHYATPPDLPGGTRHFDLAKELTKQGHDVCIFASAFVHTTRRDERLKKHEQYRRETIDGVDFCWIRTFPYHGGNDWRRVVNMLSYSVRVALLGLRLKPRPTVILASSPHPFSGLCGYLLSRVRHCGFVFEVRDLWPETFTGIGGYSDRSLVVRMARVLEKFLYRKASKIIVIAPRLSDYVTALGVPPDAIVCVPNGVNPDLFADTDVELPSRLAAGISQLRSSGKTIVGYTGSHGIADALDTVVAAARILQDRQEDRVHFIMVGDGAEKRRLAESAATLRLANMTFHPSIPKSSMPALLSAVDIAVLTKRRTNLYRYGMSFLKLFDYMMSEKPIVFAAASVNNPVAEARCGLTVPPEDPDKLVDAIVDICDMTDEERRGMGVRGHEYVIKYHSTPVLAAGLAEVLEQVGRQ